MEHEVPKCKHILPPAVQVGLSSPDFSISWSLYPSFLASCVLAVEPSLTNESLPTTYTFCRLCFSGDLVSYLHPSVKPVRGACSHVSSPACPTDTWSASLCVLSTVVRCLSPWLKDHSEPSEVPSPQRRPLGDLP